MSDSIEEIFTWIMFVILIVILVVLCTLWIWIEPLNYHFNKSDCSVWVNQEMVYNGKCHFVDVEPVGEYGNSKRVAIYYDVRKWHQKQKYISEDVEIKEYVR